MTHPHNSKIVAFMGTNIDRLRAVFLSIGWTFSWIFQDIIFARQKCIISSLFEMMLLDVPTFVLDLLSLNTGKLNASSSEIPKDSNKLPANKINFIMGTTTTFMN